MKKQRFGNSQALGAWPKLDARSKATPVTRRSRVAGVGALLVSVAILCHGAPSAHAASVNLEDAERAEQLFQAGTRAFEAAHYKSAIEQLSESYALARTYRTACGLGQVELHLSRYRDAAEHLDFCLRNFPSSGDAATQQRILTGLADARLRVFALGVRVNVEGAIVRIDGHDVATSPVEQDLFVDPGNHRVEVLRAGYGGKAADMFMPSGGQREWVVELTSVAPVSGESSASGAGYVLASGAALSGVLALGGVLFHWSGDKAGRDTAELQASLDRRCTSASTQRDCVVLRRDQERKEQLYQVSDIGLIAAAGTALATAAVYTWLVNTPVRSATVAKSASLGLSADLSPTRAGLSLAGQF